MKKAIWSKVLLNGTDAESALLFNQCIEDLINCDTVKELDNYSQHIGTSRLQHSINVAYYSFVVCRKWGLDYRSAARAGLLHDLYLYDWRNPESPRGNHLSLHPREALKNARKITELNKVEEDAIVRHMWPMTIIPPKYVESHIVSLVDKYCAGAEVMDSIAHNVFNKGMLVKRKIASENYER